MTRAALALVAAVLVLACWLAASEARFVVELGKALTSVDVPAGGGEDAP